MSAAKHTPGPLTVSVENSWPFRIVTKDASGKTVFASDMPCYSTTHKNAAEAIAGEGLDPSWNAAEHNARAIADEVLRAAAPDLLAALQGLDEAYCRAGTALTRDERHQDRCRLIAARAAIAKATGEGA